MVDPFDARIRRDYFVIVAGAQAHLRRRRGKAIATDDDAARFFGGMIPERRSVNERRRRRFDATARALSTVDPDRCTAWLSTASSADEHFLDPQKFPKREKRRHQSRCAGPVARASTSRSWREEWLVLGTNCSLDFFGSDSGDDPVFSVALLNDDFFRVVPVPAPVLLRPAFDIVCADRIIRVLVDTINDRDAWVSAIIAAATASGDDSRDSRDHVDVVGGAPSSSSVKRVEFQHHDVATATTATTTTKKMPRRRRFWRRPKSTGDLTSQQRPIDAPNETDDDDDDDATDDDESGNAVLATPGDEWAPAGRWILNARKQFPDQPDDDDDGGDDDIGTPRSLTELGAGLAKRGLDLASLGDDDAWRRSWQRFLKDAGHLRDADLGTLRTEAEKVAFWLNIYHGLLAHANLLFGPPRRGGGDFCRHFSALCWEIGGDVASLAEMEHKIIRGIRPKVMLNDMIRLAPRLGNLRLLRSALDVGQRPYDYAVRSRDPRLAYAVNPGSVSTPDAVRIFHPDHLDTQLDASARDALATAQLSGDLLLLPRICIWYGLGVHDDVVPFLPPAIRRALRRYNGRKKIFFDDDHGSGAALCGGVASVRPSSGPRLVPGSGGQRRRPWHSHSIDDGDSSAGGPGGWAPGTFPTVAYLPFGFACHFLRVVDD